MKRNYKQIQIITIISSLALFAVGCSNQGTSSQSASVPAVKVIKIGASEASGLISSGKVVADQEIQAVSKLPGKVTQVSVNEGSVVKKGQVLVQLESNDYIDQLRAAESGLRSAQAKLADTKAGARTQDIQRMQSSVEQTKAILDSTQKNYDRMKSLYDTGAISQAEFERASLDLDKARTSYDQVKAQLDLTKAGATSNTIAALQAEVDRLKASADLSKNTLDSTVVVSPIDGIVAKRNIDPGEMASPSVPLLTIVKMDQVKVETSVPQDQINEIKVGDKVDLKITGLDGTFTGTVDFVSPVSDANSSTFPVKIKVANEKGLLRSGMLAEVYLSGKAKDEIKLPSSAVVKKENKSFVFKVDGDVVHQVEIVPDTTDNDSVTVKSGVANNDQIVINPNDKLADGSKVIVR